MRFKKGQYFSFDAIVSAVIFVMAISILLNHWFALQSQMDEQTLFLQDEAIRLSQTMLTPGDYNVSDGDPSKKTTWYEDPTLATNAGFGVPNSFEGHLVHGGSGEPSISHADAYLGVGGNPYGFPDYYKYDESRLLMAIPVHYYVEFNLSITNPEDFNYGLLYPVLPINDAIGRKPSKDDEVVKLVRPVSVIDTHTVFYSPKETRNAYYTGNMTVYVWMPGSRS